MVSIIANTNNSIQYKSFVQKQWSDKKYFYWTLFIHLHTGMCFQVLLRNTNILI